MSAFDDIAGIRVRLTRGSSTDVLRGEWFFEDLCERLASYRRIAGITEWQACALRGRNPWPSNAGVDMDMMSGIYLNEMPGAVVQSSFLKISSTFRFAVC